MNWLNGKNLSETTRIVVVGSSNMDLSIHAQQIPKPGQTILGGRFLMSGGGKGANQAIAAARLGAEVVFVSCVGDDVFGQQLLSNYADVGLHTDHVKVSKDVASGVALILVDAQGENIISVASGANNYLMPDDVEAALRAIGKFQVLLLQLEVPLKTTLAAAKAAKKIGATVILDPAPAVPLPTELLEYVDILTPNEVEASLLTGLSTELPDFQKLVAECLWQMGVTNVVITLGSAGSYLATRDGHWQIGAHKVDAIDATAAGDAFNGALAVAVASGMSLCEAISEVASVASALSTTKRGAQPSLPTLEDIRRLGSRSSTPIKQLSHRLGKTS